MQSVAGNNIGYGATDGSIYIGGKAGHRLGIRTRRDDRGGVGGKYACEYQTRGDPCADPGPVENEIGSGMTGGELVVYDPRNEVPAKTHSRSVTAVDCTYVDYEWIHPLIIGYPPGRKPAGGDDPEELGRGAARGWKLRKVVPWRSQERGLHRGGDKRGLRWPGGTGHARSRQSTRNGQSGLPFRVNACSGREPFRDVPPCSGFADMRR